MQNKAATKGWRKNTMYAETSIYLSHALKIRACNRDRYILTDLICSETQH